MPSSAISRSTVQRATSTPLRRRAEEALHGVATHDIEKVDAWLGRYIGGFDRYQFTYVPFDNGEGTRHVMLVDVFPPRWGDPIHLLRKEHQNFYPG
ncbi:hypothetical protein ACWKT5_11980, partial [Streptomyces avermitilis]